MLVSLDAMLAPGIIQVSGINLYGAYTSINWAS